MEAFCGDNRDDPWGRVYRICRGRRSVEVSALRVGDSMLSTWRECAGVLLGAFFPRAEEQVPPAQEVPVPH